MNWKSMWLAATALLLLPGTYYWASPTASPIRKLETPLDNMRPETAAQWRFVRLAGSYVPPQSSYTITAPTPDEEMSLFMMSLGLIPHATAHPTSYFGRTSLEIGRHAEYILAYACAGADKNAELVTYAPGGCVFRRRRS